MKLLSGLGEETSVKRYMSFAKFLDVLEHKRLFFPKMSAFSDRLEGKVTDLDEFFMTGCDLLLANLVDSLCTVSSSSKRDARDNNAKMEERKRTYTTPFGIVDGDCAKRDFGRQRNWIDVSCWERGDVENLALWKIYGGPEQSVCVHSTIPKLKSALLPPSGHELWAGEIKYITEDDVNFDDNALSFFMRKRNFYTYENEVRLVVFDPTANWQSERLVAGTEVVVDVEKMIHTVTVSPEAETWFQDLVCNLVARRYGLTSVEVRPSKINQAAEG